MNAPMDDATFGQWLKRRRRALDLTQSALAACAACSVVTIRKFEADERRPSRQLAELLADCLRIPAADRERFIRFARQPEMAAVATGGAPALPAPPLPPRAAPPPAFAAAPPAAPALPPLPAPLTRLVGREADIAAIATLLHGPGVRAVTLTGPGGTGKTRLAIAAGRRLAEDGTAVFGDGVAFVDLSPIHDPAQVAAAIAQALAVDEVAGHLPLDALIAHLAPQRLLLILDNFEQVLDAAGDLARLLSGAGGLKLLLTSRAILRLYGEHEYPVAPLPLPAPDATDPAQVLAAPAVALFVERARAARPDFALSAGNAAAVAALCARLDGLPLAIELAAARVKLLSPAALLAQLGRALDLAGAPRHVDERQRTLRGALDWSYRLLSPDEQRLFARLGGFHGPFGLRAATAVAGEGALPADPLADDLDLDFADRLAALVDKSMIQPAGELDGEPRFRLLAVLREYALEQLDALGQADAVAMRHQAYFVALAERVAPLLEQKEQARWLRLLAADDADLRATLQLGVARPARREAVLRLATALRGFWRQRGLFSEGRAWLRQLLAGAPAGIAPDVLAAAYSTAGMLARYQDDHDAALPLLHASLERYEALGAAADPRQVAVTLRNIAAIYYWREDLERAEQYTQDILAIERAANNLPAVATMLGNLASVNKLLGRFDLTRAYQTEALALHRQVSGEGAIISCLNGLALLEFHEGRLAEAQQLYDEALALAADIEDPYHRAMVLGNVAELKMVRGELAGARADLDTVLELARPGGYTRLEMTAVFNEGLLRLLEGDEPAAAWPPMRRALDYWRTSGIRVMVDVSLYPIALLLSRAGRDAPAVQLVSYVDARTRNPVRAPDFQRMLDEIDPAARARLSPVGYAAAQAAGRALTTEAATALALREGDALAA